MTGITGATRVAGVIGDPVRHSLSPVLHNAAYVALGLDWVYAAFEVPDGGASEAIAAMRVLGLVGLSVTMPHKTAVARLCDDLTPDAHALMSVNTVTAQHDGRLVGASTDGEGFLLALRDAGVDPTGRDVVVLGAGGAARAVALALGRTGARVQVCARRDDAAAAAAELGAGEAHPWARRDDVVAGADIVVNATPVGMESRDSGATPVTIELLQPRQVVVDLIYHPLVTPLLAGARERGCTAVDGLGMLVQQAALQVHIWTGVPAPVDAMRAAAKAALANSD